MKTRVKSIGLIIIGNEILDGRRQDAHFSNAKACLQKHNLKLAYSLVLPDSEQVITSQLNWAMHKRDCPFFCCGGIGATPDDITRQCVATAADVALVPHPEGTRILQDKFGTDCTASRLRMAEFPEGARLIPNPINNVAGFSILNGYFMPGFPNMATPMMQWVLDTYYERGLEQSSVTYVVTGVREADLCDLMEQFVADHPDVSFSSLPIAVPEHGGYELHLGVSGPTAAVTPAAHRLAKSLKANAITFSKQDAG